MINNDYTPGYYTREPKQELRYITKGDMSVNLTEVGLAYKYITTDEDLQTALLVEILLQLKKLNRGKYDR